MCITLLLQKHGLFLLGSSVYTTHLCDIRLPFVSRCFRRSIEAGVVWTLPNWPTTCCMICMRCQSFVTWARFLHGAMSPCLQTIVMVICKAHAGLLAFTLLVENVELNFVAAACAGFLNLSLYSIFLRPVWALALGSLEAACP